MALAVVRFFVQFNLYGAAFRKEARTSSVVQIVLFTFFIVTKCRLMSIMAQLTLERFSSSLFVDSGKWETVRKQNGSLLVRWIIHEQDQASKKWRYSFTEASPGSNRVFVGTFAHLWNKMYILTSHVCTIETGEIREVSAWGYVVQLARHCYRRSFRLIAALTVHNLALCRLCEIFAHFADETYVTEARDQFLLKTLAFFPRTELLPVSVLKRTL